jgi:hypothetical protein
MSSNESEQHVEKMIEKRKALFYRFSVDDSNVRRMVGEAVFTIVQSGKTLSSTALIEELARMRDINIDKPDSVFPDINRLCCERAIQLLGQK